MICIQARPSEYHDIRSRNRRSPPLIAGSTNTGHERYRPTRPDKRNIGDYPEGEKEQSSRASGPGQDVNNPREYRGKTYKRSSRLVDIAKKIQKNKKIKIRVNSKLKSSRLKRFKPFTNQKCYHSLRQLETAIKNTRNWKDLAGTEMTTSKPGIFIIKAWQSPKYKSHTRHRRSGKKSKKWENECEMAALHRQARAVDIQLDWIMEDDKRQSDKRLTEESRSNLLDKTFTLARESSFTFVHLDKEHRFIHLSCPYIEFTEKKGQRTSHHKPNFEVEVVQ